MRCEMMITIPMNILRRAERHFVGDYNHNMCHHMKKPPLVGVGPVRWHASINVSIFGLFLVAWFDPRAMMAHHSR